MTEATSGNLVDAEATYPFSDVCWQEAELLAKLLARLEREGLRVK